MAETVFVSLCALWFVGLTYFQLGCAKLEAEFDPHGMVGALIGTGWLRGSTEASRRLRKLALSWAGAGLMVLVLATRIAVRYETGV